ncbi:amino acid ABC transporter membrane protein, PAAT family [Thermosyntropha lipolytica DSM 11003]|uniref:Amino acid ABC transporter membrane protein, PAAT family n=1 Tax=Thermosyntropha lipolytica DSM 11003 TaxID=1123382 RepID=A0A1M5K9A3_9FIRM|nr:amino acid ABC transporter permease [Thermosyntropha lipolytica]SHG49347.1 amino acid ABC transporter membrane protein, PAAT family [Thermosyntropha lipolytica DSM 11003]
MAELWGIIGGLSEIRGFQVVWENLPYFLEGALITIEVTALSVAMGMVLGLFAGLFRLSHRVLLRSVAIAYIDFFRGTPLFVQILLLHFGILPYFGINEAFTSAIIACGLNSGAYIGEIVRAGIQAVDKGQMEAARSLGMNERQAMTYVILPQAYKIVIPPLINEFIALLKDTSLVSTIAVAELTYRGNLVYANTYQAAWVWGAVAVIYFIITKSLGLFGDYVERRLKTE